MPHTSPPEEPEVKLKKYQKDALNEAENHFKMGLGILARIPKVINLDEYSEAEKHVDELLIIIHNARNS